MTPELRAAIDRSYEVFAGYRLGPRNLTVCRCPCCVHPETERALVTTPLREVSASLLAEYTNSVHGWDDAAIAHEFRHFLPRYLELIAGYDPPCQLGLEGCLSRMGEAGWLERWPAQEAEAIHVVFDAFLRQSLGALEHRGPGGSSLEVYDLDAVLMCMVSGGADVDRLLALWDAAADPAAAVNMAAMRQRITWSRERPVIHEWMDDSRLRAEGERIAAFLLRPEVDARLEAAFFDTEDEDWQQVISDVLQ